MRVPEASISTPFFIAMNSIESFLFGLSIPLKALSLILKTPKLLLWSLVPTFITLILYGWGISIAQVYTQHWIENFLSHWGISSQGWVTFFFVLLSKITLIFLSAITFSFFANLISCPFNDFLAEEAERYATPPLKPAPQYSFFTKLKHLTFDIGRSLFAFLVNILVLLISWIPVLNLIGFALSFLVICFQFTAYPQVRRGYGSLQGLSFIRAHLFSCLGFGSVFTFLFSIPLLSSFGLPLAVVGGTLLVARYFPDIQKEH